MASDSVPPSFILPENMRPNLQLVSHGVDIPLIDLQLTDHSLLVSQVLQACRDFGFFRVINHGIPQHLCTSVLNTINQFFELPSEFRDPYLTTDHEKKVKIFHYYANVDGHKVNMWSETLTLPWNPVDLEFLNLVPQDPPQYREVYGAYAREMGRLMERLLGLMSLGLGLEEGALKKTIGDNPELYSQANYYKPCPHPELTINVFKLINESYLKRLINV